MRRIDKIIIHCSATNESQDFCVRDIDRWHKARGWSEIGYHFVIKLDGTLEVGRDIEKVGAHCFGHNKRSIGICYIGGCDENGKPKDTRTEKQKRALRSIVGILKQDYPKATVHGHNELCNGKKACPSFEVKTEL
tara:strand:- start:30 stop:434 length:405 start_codon:yes stop_codon:yes gene_type:complete